jgi:hypothetical protein
MQMLNESDLFSSLKTSQEYLYEEACQPKQDWSTFKEELINFTHIFNQRVMSIMAETQNIRYEQQRQCELTLLQVLKFIDRFNDTDELRIMTFNNLACVYKR